MKKIIIFTLINALTVIAFAITPEMPANFDELEAGSAENPYLISSLNNLLWVAVRDTLNDMSYSERWSKHYEQTTDIDASPVTEMNDGLGWNPIGYWETRFTGSYDGNGFIISNLTINRPTSNRNGFFGVTHNASISNLGIVDAVVVGLSESATLVGHSGGGTIVSNCFASGVVTAPAPNVSIMGGLVALNSISIIMNSYSHVTVNGTGSNIGGLVGQMLSNPTAGALVSNSFSTGDVTGIAAIGGFVGSINSGPPHLNFPVTQILDSYSRGNVTHLGGPLQVGGFIGQNLASVVNRCYSTGSVQNADGLDLPDKGFVGQVNTAGNFEMSNNYWDTETSNQASTGGSPGQFATGLNTVQMQQEASFEDWDFEEIWAINSTVNDGYPYLRHFSYEVGILIGDINRDGEVTPMDASVVLQYYVGLDPIPEIDPLPWTDESLMIADVDLNGAVQPLDAAFILQYYVGIIDELPVLPSRVTQDLTASVDVVYENGHLTFYSEKKIFGLGVEVPSEYINYLGQPFVNGTSWMTAQNIDNSTYKFALARAEVTNRDNLLLSIPVLAQEVVNIGLTLQINNQEAKRIYVQALDTENEVPELVTALNGNYPNPFNPDTNIVFSLAEAGKITIEVYNIRGQRVITLVNEKMESGNHKVMWNGFDYQGKEVGSGIFFTKMQTENYLSVKKMILIK